MFLWCCVCVLVLCCGCPIMGHLYLAVFGVYFGFWGWGSGLIPFCDIFVNLPCLWRYLGKLVLSVYVCL